MNLLNINLASLVASMMSKQREQLLANTAGDRTELPEHHTSHRQSDEDPGGPSPLMEWVVFILCLAFSILGVSLSFQLLGSKITGTRLWGVGFVIAIVMLGISYGAKFANPHARRSFTPVDLIQYVTQGFLWPTTWPALADFLGIQKIAPPTTSLLNEQFHALVAALFV